MFKKTVLIISGVILLLMAAIFLFAKDIEIRVSEIEAQAAIDDYLASGSSQRFGINMAPKSIRIDFKADNSAQITSQMMLDGHGYSGQFDGVFSTGISYRIPRLYLDKPELIEGGFLTDNQTRSELSELKGAALNVLRRKRKSLEGETPAPTPSDQTDEDVLEGFIVSATQGFFESLPIYDLRRSGQAGGIASLALKEVNFTDEAAIITLSPVTALLRILAALGLFCLSIVYVLRDIILSKLLSRATKGKAD